MKRKVVICASSQDANKQEAKNVLNKLKEAFNAIDSCSQETFVKYVPESIYEDLNIAIREMSSNLDA